MQYENIGILFQA